MRIGRNSGINITGSERKLGICSDGGDVNEITEREERESCMTDGNERIDIGHSKIQLRRYWINHLMYLGSNNNIFSSQNIFQL